MSAVVSRGGSSGARNKDYQESTLEWRRRGCCGVRRRPSCADWSDGFGPSIAGLQRPAVSGYASRLGLFRVAGHRGCYGQQTPIELGAVVGEQTHHRVIIIGAGFAGLGLAIPLQQPK
jgi:hypothetical protein